MSVRYTYHGPARPSEGSGDIVSALGPQVGVGVDVADGAVSSALSAAGLYRIVAKTNSLVKIASTATNGTDGEYWFMGATEVRYLDAGQKIGVSAG